MGILGGLLQVGVSLGLQYLLRNSGQDLPPGPRLEDFKIRTSTYGSDITQCYGASRISGNLIWTAGIEEVVVTTKIKSGGLFDGSTKQKSFLYFSTFSIGVSEGVSQGPLKVFLDGQLVYDGTGTGNFSAEDHELIWYDGRVLQKPSQIIIDDKGGTVGNTDVPGFRNLAHCIFNVLPLQKYGNRIPNFTAIIACNRVAAGPQQDVDNQSDDASNRSDALWYDSRSGYIYKFDWLVTGGSGTTITKIDATDGTVVYSKLLVGVLGGAIRLHDAVEGQKIQQSPIDGMLYGLISSASNPTITKIDPDLGRVILSAAAPGMVNPFVAFGLWLARCPTTGGPIECWMAKSNAPAAVTAGMTGNASLTIPLWGGAEFSLKYPFQEFIPEDRFVDGSGQRAWQFTVAFGAPAQPMWMLSSTIAGNGTSFLTKFIPGVYFHKDMGRLTPCMPKMPGDPPFLRWAAGAGVDPSDRNGRTYSLQNRTQAIPAFNLGAPQKNGNVLVHPGYDLGDHSADAGTTTTLNVTGAQFITDGVRPGMNVERTGGFPDVEEIQTIVSETQLTHTAMSSGWVGGESFRFRNTFDGGSGTQMALVGLDNSFILSNRRQGLPAWAFGKFSLDAYWDGGEQMIENYHQQDYELKDPATGIGSDFEFSIDKSLGSVDGSITRGAIETWHNYGGYHINGPLNEPFWGYDGEIFQRVNPETMRIESPDSVQLDTDFTGAGLNAGASMILIPNGTEAVYIDSANGSGTIAGAEGGSLVYLRRAAGSPEDLASVVADLCSKAGLLPHEYDASALAGEQVRGYAIGSMDAVKSSLDPLMVAYDFQYVESDWQIKFVKKGGSSVFTFVSDDLGVSNEKELVVPTRISENENVRKITVKYISEERDHQTSAQEAFRILDPLPTSFSKNKDTIDVPILFRVDEAQNIARRVLGRVWTERTLLQWSAPPKYLGVDPTDIVTVIADGTTHTAQVQDSGHGGGFQTKVRARSDDAAALTNSQGFGSFGDFVSPTIALTFRTQVAVMDGPLVNSADDPGPGQFTIRSQFIYGRSDFPGASADWGPINQGLNDWFAKSTAAQHGKAVTVLGAAGLGQDGSPGSVHTLDTVNTVEVFMANGVTLQSATDDIGFLECDAETGGTCCYLGGEIIQAKTATLQGSGTYLLSDLLRARFGTEQFAMDHGAGDAVVILRPGQDDSVHVAQRGNELIGTTYGIEATINGSSQVEQAEHLFIGRSLRPYAPAMLDGERDASDNLTARWVRRDRVPADGVGWGDEEDDTLPLSEVQEEYEAVLLINGTFDPNVHDNWRESVSRSVVSDPGTTGQPDLTFEANFNDLGTTPQNTADITDVAALEDFSGFTPHSWVALTNFDQGDMNSFFVVESAVTATLKLRVGTGTGDDTSNDDARVAQLRTYAVFTAAEVAAAGYNTTEPVDVVVYQISATVGRGYPAYRQFGLGG